MMVLGGGALSYERGTPVGGPRRNGCPGGTAAPSYEDLGQLGQDEPRLGMTLEPLLA